MGLGKPLFGTAQGRIGGLCWGAMWDCAGAQCGATQGCGGELRKGTVRGCTGAQYGAD